MEIQTYDGLHTPPAEYVMQKCIEAKLSGSKGKIFDWNKAATIIKEKKAGRSNCWISGRLVLDRL